MRIGRLIVTLAAVVAITAAPDARAQAARRHVEQELLWLQLFHEQRVGGGVSLLGEVQLRRADLAGRTPQQLLARTGVLYAVTPQLGVGLGYAYAGTSVYGDLPAPRPFPEHRLWQQLTLAQTTGAVRWSQRFRVEQRWIGRVDAATGELAEYLFRQRFRPLLRANVDLPRLGIPAPRLYLTAWDELFVVAGETTDGQVFDQNRLALQLGVRFGPRVRAELGVLQQLVQRGGSRSVEDNRVVVLSVFTVAGGN